jgi:hypothetical protein
MSLVLLYGGALATILYIPIPVSMVVLGFWMLSLGIQGQFGTETWLVARDSFRMRTLVIGIGRECRISNGEFTVAPDGSLGVRKAGSIWTRTLTHGHLLSNEERASSRKLATLLGETTGWQVILQTGD